MPEISSLPALPAVVGPAPVAAITLPADGFGAGLSFLSQLKTALASLASAALPQTVAATQTSIEPQVPTEASDEAVPADDKKDDVMPEMLAALGFLPVPMVLQPPVQPTTAEAAPFASQHAAPLDLKQTPQDPNRTDDTSTAPIATSAPLDLPTTPEALGAPATPPTQLVMPPTTPTVAPPVPHDVSAKPHHETAPVASTEASLTPVAAQHGLAAQPRFGQAQGDTSSTGDDRDAETLKPIESRLSDTASPDQQVQAAAAGITTTAPIANAALPPHVRPSEVVNQIAHQADLYRLPGNKGVRIQLHPEDLGGVDVTLRYSAAGGIQLHINVEHASTGALVQAGWSDLRDALANQGISPDRLIMSVTSPSNANATDFSSNSNNGSRSDLSQSSFGFGQGQSGGQAHDGESRRVSRVWFGDGELSSSQPDETPRVAAGSARIDYRV